MQGEATYSRSVVCAGFDILNNPQNNYYGRISNYIHNVIEPEAPVGWVSCPLGRLHYVIVLRLQAMTNETTH